MQKLEMWKFKLKHGLNRVKAPFAGAVCHVHAQGDDVCVWAGVNREAVDREVVLQVVGTGEPFSPVTPYAYRGTAHVGEFVWHVFEVA